MTNNSNQTYDMDEQIQRLADLHHQYSEGISHAYRLNAPDSNRNVIRLLYVDSMTPPSGCVPLHFGPHPSSGIFYPSEIISLTPVEFDQLQSDQLSLPEGWKLGSEIKFNLEVQETN
ncbi:hypothetical protein [Lacunimicrobium album]